MIRYRSAALAVAVLAAAGSAVLTQSSTPADARTRKLAVNGTNLSYVEQGIGVPVVFVHGAVADLRFWEPQRDAFSKQHRFVAYTYRYHGTDPWPDQGTTYSIDQHVADLTALIKGLKAGPVHLVGLSYGGLLAAMVAAKEPALVRTLTLAEPALFALIAVSAEGKAALQAWSKDTAPIIESLKTGDNTAAVRQLHAAVSGTPAETFDNLPVGLRQVLLDNARTMSLLFKAPPGTMECGTLKTIAVPTLVVRGEATPDIFRQTNAAVAQCIPGSREVVVPKASHAMSYGNPAGFNRVVLQFLAKHPGTTKS
jgi:pimeloyl-ACP methyl ester carboxylesterase